MAKPPFTSDETNLYYKYMTLTNAGLTVAVKEKADYSYTDANGNRVENIEPAEVTIYHSPRKWDDDRFMIHLKNRKELREYIEMLQVFEEKYGDLLDQVQGSEN